MRRRRTHHLLQIVASASLATATGCWLVAGLEDRSLLGGDVGDGGSDGSEGGPGDGSTNDGGGDGSNEGGPGTKCNVDDPFEEGGRPVMNLSSPEREYNATLSEDELEILFSSEWDYVKSVPARAAIWRSTRTSRTASFGAPTKLPFEETSGWGSPTLADDAGLLYLVGYPNDTYPGLAYFTGRVAPGEYGTEMGQVVGDPSGSDYIFLDSLGTTTLFAKRRAVGAPLALFSKTSAPDGGLSTASSELTTISVFVPDGGYDVAAPVMTRGGEVLYFVITPVDNSKNEIYRAKRATSGSKGDWDTSSIKALTEINVASPRSFPAWASPDLCRLYVSQFRSPNTRELWVYEKKPR